jgi:hypothetical protein
LRGEKAAGIELGTAGPELVPSGAFHLDCSRAREARTITIQVRALKPGRYRFFDDIAKRAPEASWW